MGCNFVGPMFCLGFTPNYPLMVLAKISEQATEMATFYQINTYMIGASIIGAIFKKDSH